MCIMTSKRTWQGGKLFSATALQVPLAGASVCRNGANVYYTKSIAGVPCDMGLELPGSQQAWRGLVVLELVLAAKKH